VEVARTLNRLRIEGGYSDAEHSDAIAQFSELAAAIAWVPISDAIIELAAQPTPRHMKALDAIHLASARALRDASRESVTFATHDRRLAAAAAMDGFQTAGTARTPLRTHSDRSTPIWPTTTSSSKSMHALRTSR
jgi:predicted nucleic acid-binding protein